MAISREDIEQVSLLSRLLLSQQELDTMTAQLGQILDYINLLGEVNTDDVQPMAHAVESSDVFRADVARPSLDRQEALANAPHQDGECYRVPAVLGVG